MNVIAVSTMASKCRGAHRNDAVGDVGEIEIKTMLLVPVRP